MKQLAITAIVILAAIAAHAQDTDTRIFDRTFKSLRAYVDGNYYAPPIITLNGSDKIKIEFDQLSPDMQYLRYSIMHCNADWTPSQLIESEYVDGFNEANVEQFDYSQATFTNYVHYEITLPNDNMLPTISGNYLLKVYPENDAENILLQVRFALVENAVDIAPEVTSRTDIDYNKRHQQVSVTVSTRDYQVDDPYNDLMVSVAQNMTNTVMVHRPLRVAGKDVIFEHDRKLIFPAGNEFRRFEMTTTNYTGMGIDRYSFHEPYYHVDLKTDAPRSFKPYSYDRTQYGRFTIRMSDAVDNNTEADYMVVHFALKMPETTGGKVYVDGEFTQHALESSNTMHYNQETQCYELDMMLKQGAYNYRYLWIPDGSNKSDNDMIEGDFYQTVNEYLILTYHRKRGERYDRLIGMSIIYSGK